ncbi:MAG: hypothetical protein ACKO7Z_00820 [Cyanobacteriota bacterium]
MDLADKLLTGLAQVLGMLGVLATLLLLTTSGIGLSMAVGSGARTLLGVLLPLSPGS